MRTIRLIPAVALLAASVVGCGLGATLPVLPRVSELERARSRAHREKGVERLARQGKVYAAASEFALALESDPADPEARLWAAWTAGLLGDEQAEFEHFLQAARLKHPTAELAIWSAYRAFVTRAQAQRLARVLAEVIQRPDTPPLVRDRALHYHGHTLRYLGRFEQAGSAFDRLGYVRDWMVVGPFDNDQNAGFDKAFPPEEGFSSYDLTYRGKLHDVRWRRVEHFAPDGRVSLRALLDPSRWATSYLVTWIRSPTDQSVALRLAAFRGVKVWLNDRLLLSDDEAHVAALDQYAAGGKLETGWNKLLLKVCQRDGPWQVGLRLTDLAGNPLAGLKFDTSIHAYPDRSPDRSPLPEPERFERWLATRPADDLTAVLQTIWNLRLGFFKLAVERGVELAASRNRCPLSQMLLARVHFKAEHEDSALRALRAAERIAPGLPAALFRRSRYEQGHKRYERAMRILKPLMEADPVLPAARALHISLMSARGWHTDALRAAREFAREQPDRAWTWRMIGAEHFELLQIPDGMRAYSRALRLRADHKDTYDELITRELLLGRMSRALELIRTRTRVFPDLISAALQEARYLLADEKYAAALAVCDRIEAIAPDFWQLHKVRGEILYRQGEKAEALAEYRRSLECAPDNPDLREYMDFLVHHPDEAFERYGLTDEHVEQILDKRPDPAAYPEADAVFLLDDLVTHVFADGSAKHLVRQVFLILNEKGQRSFTKFRVPSSSSFRLDVAETIQPDGTHQEATSIRRGVIHLPSLRPGSILHVAYRFDSASSSWMEDHYASSFLFQGSHPVRRARWVLVLPADKELAVLERGPLVKRSTQELAGEAVYIWSAADVPMLHRESRRPPLRNIRSAVFVSTVPDWETLARWQNSLIQDQFEIDEEIRIKTEEITRSAATPMEKLEAIYRFVAKEVRYLDHDVGIFGKKPNKAVNVFANRFGDCKDKATLMIAMLEHAGIEARYAGVRTRDRGDVFWEVPYAQTNHIITYIPAQPGIGEALFVDGTSRFGHFRYLPERDQGIKALVLDGKGHQVLDTPALPPDASATETVMRASLAGSDALVIRADESWRGWFAYRHRSRLHTEGKRIEEFGKDLNYRFPGARLGEARFRGLDDLRERAGVDYVLTVPGQVRREDDTLRLKLLWPSNLTANLAPKPRRRYDLFNLYAMTVKAESTLELPEGYAVKTLPEPLVIDDEHFGYEHRCESAEGRVTCRRTFQLRSHLVPRDSYERFRANCLAVDRTEKQDIVLAPTAP